MTDLTYLAAVNRIAELEAERDAAYVTGWNEATYESLLKEDAAAAHIAALETERDTLRELLVRAEPRIVPWSTGSNDVLLADIRAALSTEEKQP